MKLLLLFILLFPSLLFAQQQGTVTDSTSTRLLSEKYIAAHQLMVCFTKGSTADLNDFYTYLLSELHYKTDKPNTLTYKQVKTGGLSITFAKYGDEYKQASPGITVYLNCNKDGSNLKSASITGADDLLTEVFVKYFGGTASATTTILNAVLQVLTPTDEVKLLSGKITISPQQPQVITIK